MSRGVLTVRELAVKVFGDHEKASNWYYTQKPSPLLGKTPSEMVREGREGEVRDLLNKIDSGYVS